MLMFRDPLTLYPIEKGMDDLDKNSFPGLVLKVNSPPRVSITDVSGLYEGAAKGINVDLPLDTFQLVIESIRCRKLFFLATVSCFWAISWQERQEMMNRKMTPFIIGRQF
jgi:hypothetical protein